MSTDRTPEPVSLRVHYMHAPDRGVVHDLCVSRVADPSSDDGLCWEFMIQWSDLHHGRRPPAVQIRAFDDSWAAFAQIPAFWAWLAERHCNPPDLAQVVAMLGVVVDGRIAQTGYWPEGCGVVGEAKPVPVDPAYARVARWILAGESYAAATMPAGMEPAEYIARGLPGWEG